MGKRKRGHEIQQVQRSLLLVLTVAVRRLLGLICATQRLSQKRGTKWTQGR